MKRDFLTNLGIEKETIDSIMAEHGKALTATKAKLTESETQLAEVQTKVTGLEESLTKRDADIETLKKSDETNEVLKTQLAEMQTKYDADKAEAEKKLIQAKTDSAIELALTNAKAKNIKTVLPLLDAEKLALDGNMLKGMDKQLETIKTDNPFLFESVEADPTPPATPQITVGGNPQGTPPGEKSWRDRMKENVAKAKKQE